MKKDFKFLLNRQVRLVDYFSYEFGHTIKGTKRTFKVYPEYPFCIKDIFYDHENVLKVNLEYTARPHIYAMNCKPLKNIDFLLTDSEKKKILSYLNLSDENRNLHQKFPELFKEFWYLRIDTIIKFLVNKEYKHIIKKNFFEIDSEIGENEINTHTLINFQLDFYKFGYQFRKSNKNFQKLKDHHISFIIFHSEKSSNAFKIDNIFLHPESTHIFFFLGPHIILFPMGPNGKNYNDVKNYIGNYHLKQTLFP